MPSLFEFLKERVAELHKTQKKVVPKLKNIYRNDGVVTIDLDADDDDFGLSSDEDFDFDFDDLDYEDTYDEFDEDEL